MVILISRSRYKYEIYKFAYLVVKVTERAHVVADSEDLATIVVRVVEHALGARANANGGDLVASAESLEAWNRFAETPHEGLKVGITIGIHLTWAWGGRPGSPF